MVMIPQQTRQSIASSAVGTPGVDTSGLQIGEAAQKFSETVAGEAFQAGIAKRQSMDEAQTNQIMTGTKLKMINDFEQHKIDFAKNPEAGAPVFAKQMQDTLDTAAESAPNARVKLALQKGDPQFQGRLLMMQGAWASQQDLKNTLDYGVNATTALGEKAADIGSDVSTSVDEKRQLMLPLVNTLGNVVNSIKATRRPDLANEFAVKGMKSLYQGLVQKTIDTQPEQALQLLEDKHMGQFFKPNELDAFKKGALEAVTGQKAQADWRGKANDLVSQPDLVHSVVTGKMGWGDIDQAQKNDSNPDKPIYGVLKTIANKQYPDETTAEQESLKVQLYDEAHRLGVGIKGKTPTDNVKDLLRFNDDLLSAKSRGLINNQSFNMMFSQIASPLVGSVLATHDPHWLESLAADQKSVWHGLAKSSEDMVNKYNSGYAAIDGYLTAQGIDKQSGYFRTKSGLLDLFFKTADAKIGNPNYHTSDGKLYTAEDVAHDIMGIGMGNMIKTSLGMRKINGYKSPGVPTIETTPEDDELLKGPLNRLQKAK